MSRSKLPLAVAAHLALLGGSFPLGRAADSVPAELPPLEPANLDKAIKPGDDFYHLANGGWIARNPIPPEYPRWGSCAPAPHHRSALTRGVPLPRSAEQPAGIPEGVQRAGRQPDGPARRGTGADLVTR